MNRLSRRQWLGGTAITAAAVALGAPSVHAQKRSKLVTDWVRATDQTKWKQLADEVQRVALSEVAYVPWGEWFQPTAYRKNVQGVLRFGAPVFWNVRVT